MIMQSACGQARKGDGNGVGNYIPIVDISCLSKCFLLQEQMPFKRALKWRDYNGFLKFNAIQTESSEVLPIQLGKKRHNCRLL